MLKSAGFLFAVKYFKPALTYEDQFNLLLSRRLLCENRDEALSALRRIGYYRLSAYFIPFRDPGANNFRLGTTLEAVLKLYEFDADLRLLTMKAIALIEVAARTSITYRMTYGLGVFGYAESANFQRSFNHIKLMKTVEDEERRSQESFVKHFRRTYTDEAHLPFWMVTELLSFGALSTMYSHLLMSLRKEVAADFGQPEPVFTSWLHALSGVRNICAHHGRLWNRGLGVRPKLPDAWKAWKLENDAFYMIALVIAALLNEVAPQFGWKKQIATLLDGYSKVNLSQMHFPADWQTQGPFAALENPNKA